MGRRTLLLLSGLPWLTAATTLPQHREKDVPSASISNAYHIFSSIHDSMRQFGSSLNHNGMGVFIAHVPEGTELYHGTSSPYPVNGTEWLAFEPEHAMIFSRPRRPPPGVGEPPEHGPPRDKCPPRRDPQEDEMTKKHMKPKDPSIDENPRGIIGALGRLFGQQTSFEAEDVADTLNTKEKKNDDEEEKFGYVHTYRTKHALRLMYLDGQSAAKSDKGTLDVQDIVIRNVSGASPHGMWEEKLRASEMCRMAQADYQGHIDGILRMEGGFEIILCSFATHLDVVRITADRGSGEGFGGHDGKAEDLFSYYEAVAARYDGIGAGRVRLDYDNPVTLFAYPEAMYFDSTGRPRVDNRSTETLERVRADIKKMVLTPHSKDSDHAPTNWQDITDQIIARYADKIEYMTSGKVATLKALKGSIDQAMRPFIDYSARNTSLEIGRCTRQFWPSGVEASSIASLAVRDTYEHLCSSLAAAAGEDDYDGALATVKELKQSLGWTTWKRCRGCGVHEICLLPIWPVGSEEDFIQPQCVSSDTIEDRRGNYWRDR
ncbi:hypothetical protein AAFC00_005019 [Neodothiora populina]|uniref:Uncharacterized protein n=1 Tax=Neodothiora populina TaxID=2781224 RepID=A0ABR3P5C9_9PEZI